MACLVDAGRSSYDDTVASHWPEFAAAGKEHVTVRQMMSHQAALPYVDQALSFDDLLAMGPVVEALASQSPVWEPGTSHGYHALSYGRLVGDGAGAWAHQNAGARITQNVPTCKSCSAPISTNGQYRCS